MNANKIKIAMLRTTSQTFNLSNYNIQEVGLAKELLKYGISTDIYARAHNIISPINIKNSPLGEIKFIPLRGIHVYRDMFIHPGLAKTLCEGKYDLVQILDESQIMTPYILFRLNRQKIPAILYQGMYENFSGIARSIYQKTFDILFKKYINASTRVKIAKTDSASKYLKQKGYTNIYTIPVGLSPQEKTSNTNLEKEILEFKNKHKYILLYVGVFEKRRDVHFLIEVLKEIRKQSHEYGMVMVGTGSELEKVKSETISNNLERHVMYYPSIKNSELHILYKESDTFLLPTENEIFGMVVLESLFYGVPVISTPAAGPLYILNDSRLGLCIEKTLQKWVSAIALTVEQKEFSEFRTQNIVSHYSWESIANSYISALQSNGLISQTNE